MEKQSSISSSKFIGSTLDNIILNSKINLSKIKEVITTMDKASKAIIIPILKIQKKLTTQFDTIIQASNDKKEKKESAKKEAQEPKEESKVKFINTTNPTPTQKSEDKTENIIEFYNNMINNIELFTKLLKSDEYDKLIKGFDEILPDKEIFMEEEIEKEKKIDEDKIQEKIKEMEANKEKMEVEIEKVSKHSNKVKRSKKTNSKKNIKKSVKKTGSKAKDKKNSQKGQKRPKKSKDLLEILHQEFPDNSYIQKISKTFLSRRLFKTVIYRHFFEYKENGLIVEDRVRSAGDSTVYKYGKVTFKFLNDEIKDTEKIDEIMGKELKQQFYKLDEENKEYIIGGKIGCTLSELIQKIFKNDLLKEFNIVKATLEFYEFYEELVNEFDENDKNVKIISCDEKVLNHLREDWKSLDIARKYISQKKKPLAVVS
jgi:hypothetical protein